MGSSEEAIRLRRLFGKKNFAERQNSGIRLMNSVTPATRVRISVMKSITVAYKAMYPNGLATLVGYVPRPIVRCRPKALGPIRAYGYTEAVVGLNLASLGLTDSDFEKAYRIAGRKFLGEMRSSFIVLKDDSPLCVLDERQDNRKRTAEESPGSNPSRRVNFGDEMEVVDLP